MEMRSIWAFDHHSLNEPWLDRTTYLLNTLNETHKSVVDPVCILPNDPPLGMDKAGLEKFQQSLETKIKTLGLVNASSPKVIHCDDPLFRTPARGLAHYVDQSNAEMVVLSARPADKKGGMLDPSFAQNFVLYSPLPVLIVSPTKTPLKPITHILFATDFSPEAFRSLNQVLIFCRIGSASLTVYHHTTAGQATDFEEAEIQSEHWVTQALKFGVNPNVIIEKDPKMSPDEAIIDIAKRESVDLVVLSTHATPFHPDLFSSITRKVLSQPPCSLWVFNQKVQPV